MGASGRPPTTTPNMIQTSKSSKCAGFPRGAMLYDGGCWFHSREGERLTEERWLAFEFFCKSQDVSAAFGGVPDVVEVLQEPERPLEPWTSAQLSGRRTRRTLRLPPRLAITAIFEN